MNHCQNCGCETANPKYCNRSCAAKQTNKQHSLESRSKQRENSSKSLKGRIRNHKLHHEIEGPYTKIFLCTCKITGKTWFSTSVRTIHPTVTENRSVYAYKCRFSFSISQYPDWFNYATNLIATYGWYSAANRGGNRSGCSRDHMFSVSDGFALGIDPKIMSHPANCQIIPHPKNQQKYSSSSITLDELYSRIELFDSVHGRQLWESNPVS